MEKIFIVFFIFILFFSFVSSEWDDSENTSEFENDDESIGLNVTLDEAGSGILGGTEENDDRETGEGKYTIDFFIASGILVLGLIIVIFLIYMLFRKPKNKWEK